MAAELKLERQGALDHLADAFAAASNESLQIRALPGCAVVNLRAAPEDPSLLADVQRVLGVELPCAPNRWHGNDRLAAVWLGPDEWLLMARDEVAERIEAELRAVRPTDPWLSMVDISHNYAQISLAGAVARPLLARGCSLDLHPDIFVTGDCVQTILARSRAILRAVDDDAFEIWVRNSFADYMANWLLQSCADLRRLN